MDNKNLFESRWTYALHRAEYALALGISLYFLFANYQDVNWWYFIALFAYIDLIGYIPGAIAYQKSDNKQIPKLFYVLYNSMHSLVSGAFVVGICWLVFGPNWAMLAVPIHLCGDRAVFGNFLKPFGVSFEPVEHPTFAQLKKEVG